MRSLAGSPGVVVAVIDTGAELSHPSLGPNVWSNPGEIPGNVIDDDGNGEHHAQELQASSYQNNRPERVHMPRMHNNSAPSMSVCVLGVDLRQFRVSNNAFSCATVNSHVETATHSAC